MKEKSEKIREIKSLIEFKSNMVFWIFSGEDFMWKFWKILKNK